MPALYTWPIGWGESVAPLLLVRGGSLLVSGRNARNGRRLRMIEGLIESEIWRQGVNGDHSQSMEVCLFLCFTESYGFSSLQRVYHDTCT